jgi:hypothetical protein
MLTTASTSWAWQWTARPWTGRHLLRFKPCYITCYIDTYDRLCAKTRECVLLGTLGRPLHISWDC